MEQMGRDGVPVVLMIPPWPNKVLDEMSERGLHKSCDNHLNFLREEMLEFARKGFWLVLPYRIVRERLLQQRLSPL